MLAENSNPDPRSASGKEGRRGEGRSPAPAVPRTWGVHGAHRMPWPSEHGYRGRCGCLTPPTPLPAFWEESQSNCLIDDKEATPAPRATPTSGSAPRRDAGVTGRTRRWARGGPAPAPRTLGQEGLSWGPAARACAAAPTRARASSTRAFTLRFDQLSPLFSLLGKEAK